jgi:GT2 family glycosyltransferase
MALTPLTGVGPCPDGTPITVVMITRDRRAQAVQSVDLLIALPERPRVIVVDNGSTDGTVAALSRRSDVRLVAAGRNLGAAGRNLGVAEARTPYVAFADDDSAWAPGALAAAADLLAAHPRLGMLVARTLVGPGHAEDPMNQDLAAAPLGREQDLPGPTVLGFLACAAVVRRDAFLDVGGFHPRFGIGGEEQMLALDLLAAGWGAAYVPEVIAHHRPADGGNRPGRRAVMVRNQLWTYWLRRRLPAASRCTLAAARAARHDAAARRGLLTAGAGLPWVVLGRRPIPRQVEQLARRVDPWP